MIAQQGMSVIQVQKVNSSFDINRTAFSMFAENARANDHVRFRLAQ